jgi:hypothetical protein
VSIAFVDASTAAIIAVVRIAVIVVVFWIFVVMIIVVVVVVVVNVNIVVVIAIQREVQVTDPPAIPMRTVAHEVGGLPIPLPD